MGHGSPGVGSPVLDPLGSGPRVPMADGLPPGTTFVHEVLGRLGPCSGGQSSHGMTVVWDMGHGTCPPSADLHDGGCGLLLESKLPGSRKEAGSWPWAEGREDSVRTRWRPG